MELPVSLQLKHSEMSRYKLLVKNLHCHCNTGGEACSPVCMAIDSAPGISSAVGSTSAGVRAFLSMWKVTLSRISPRNRSSRYMRTLNAATQ